MNILALDPAQRCGYAHSAGPRGVWLLTATGAAIEDQHMRLEKLLDEAIELWGCDLLATENAGFGSHNPAVQAMHNERLGVIRLVAARHSIRVATFQPTTIKLFATGDGRAKKPAMIAACQRLLGIDVISDDEADAVWILELAKRPDCWAKTPKKKAKKAKAPRGKKATNRLF